MYKNLNFDETELIKQKMMSFIRNKVFKIFELGYEQEEIKGLEDYYPFIVATSSVIINQWLKDDMNMPTNKITDLLKAVISSIIKEMKKSNI